ncbi:MAG: alkaline phosphatase [Blastomonas sp.]
MTLRKALAALVPALLASASCHGIAMAQETGADSEESSKSSYYRDAEIQLERQIADVAQTGKARNLIIFIGDGMGVSSITAGRIYKGQKHGQDGESYPLAMDSMPWSALVKTYSHDFQVADSAATATAIVTGTKTRSGMLGVGPEVVRDDCAASLAGSVPTLFEMAEDKGLATGVISTARITHATPASTYSHAPNRDWENDTMLPAGSACKDIARQLVEWPHGDGFEVVFGGGRANFLPKGSADPEYADKTGARGDGRDLTAEWMAAHPNGRFVWNSEGFQAFDPMVGGPVLGLFERSHMQFEADRAGDSGGEPSLADMVSVAIAKLSRDPDGFVLMVEGGRIDHAHHAGNAKRALEDLAAFDDAIARTLTMVNMDETLVLVTADHSHVFTIAGYPPRNNPILGLGSIDEDGHTAPARDGKSYTTLGYMNGPGAVPAGERPDPADQDTEALDYLQQSLVPTHSETHGGEDVALKAAGPQAQLFHGTIEQNLIFHIARHILGW